MPDEQVTDRATNTHPRCEVGETLQGGHCELPGEVEFKGLLLCEWHASQFEAYDRIDLLEGIVSSLELCLRNILLRRDANIVRLSRFRRAWATQELHRAREDLRLPTTMVDGRRQ